MSICSWKLRTDASTVQLLVQNKKMQEFLEKRILFVWSKMSISAFERISEKDQNLKIQLLNFAEWRILVL